MEAWPCPLSSRAQPRDLQFRGPFLEMSFDGAKPRACPKVFSLLVLAERPNPTRLFLKKSRTSLPCPVQSRSENALSEVEWGSAVRSTDHRCTGKAPPFPLSSRAKPRDLQFAPPTIEAQGKHQPKLCHPDRSAAKWRDLLFSPPATGCSNESTALPFVIPSEAEGSAVLQARPGNVFSRKRLGFEARRACPELVEGTDRQTSALPGRAGASKDDDPERRRCGTLPLCYPA